MLADYTVVKWEQGHFLPVDLLSLSVSFRHSPIIYVLYCKIYFLHYNKCITKDRIGKNWDSDEISNTLLCSLKTNQYSLDTKPGAG